MSTWPRNSRGPAIVRRGASIAALLPALFGCAVGPDFVQPQAPAVDHYTSGTDPTATIAAEGVAQQFEPAKRVAARWWKLFVSPKIDAVIVQAEAANPTIEAAQASLRESQYELRAGYGVFYPSVTAGLGVDRQQYSPLKVGEVTAPSIFSLFTLSASVSYVLDVFGGERRTVEGLGAAVDVQDADALAAYLTITSNVVNTIVAKAAYIAELDATREIVGIERQQVKLAQVKADAGTAPYSSVLSIESQLDTFEAQIPGLEQKIVQADHLLATLVGRTPAEWRPPDIRLDELALPRTLPVSLPSDLVRHRPDILAAEATLHEASAGIGVATAALLPSVMLNADYGFNNTAANDLFVKNARYWEIGANITQPVFEGGTLWFHRKAAIAAFDQAAATYRQTVLAAFAQVADTLRALEHDAATLEAQDRALHAADGALHLVQANYQAGLADYTEVLIADAQFYQAKISDLEALALRYQDTVALFAALGGGW